MLERRVRAVSAWGFRVLFRQESAEAPRFGNVVIVLFLLAQAADGVLTYVGVTTLGSRVEANPLLALLMTHFGEGAALVGAKILASSLGIALHLVGVHRLLAVLTVVYILGALLPWAGLLLLM
jgi:uncharacterized membrane protein